MKIQPLGFQSTDALFQPGGKASTDTVRQITQLMDTLRTITFAEGTIHLIEWDASMHSPVGSLFEKQLISSSIRRLVGRFAESKKLNKLAAALVKPEVFSKLSPCHQRLVSVVYQHTAEKRSGNSDLFTSLAQSREAMYSSFLAAKEQDDFTLFASDLEQFLQHKREAAEVVGFGDGCNYDVSLNTYIPGMTVAKLDILVEELKKVLIPMAQVLNEKTNQLQSKFSKVMLEKSNLHAYAQYMAGKLGFDFSRGRVDIGSSGIAFNVGVDDVRLVVRANENNFRDSHAVITHETGHGIHSQQTSKTLAHTPLFFPPMVLCESQARFYETLIGKNKGFLQHIHPEVVRHFPGVFSDMSVDDLYLYLNTVKAGVKRVTADEVTYNLHIIIGYELERDLMSGVLDVSELAEAFNEKMGKYLGVKAENDNEGILQDVHLGQGLIGYRSSYMIGNLYAAQFFNAANVDLSHDLEDILLNGELDEVNSWLLNNVHQHGNLVCHDDLLLASTGEGLNPQYAIDYLKKKYGELYGMTL